MILSAITEVQPIYKITSAKAVGSTGIFGASSDSMTISEESKLSSLVFNAINNKDEDREDRIKKLKKDIAEGKYTVDDRMLEHIALSLLD